VGPGEDKVLSFKLTDPLSGSFSYSNKSKVFIENA
jgi:hypothetical protein